MFLKIFICNILKFCILVILLHIIEQGGLFMNEDLNRGVRCNVCDCVYNEHGCNCNKMVIDVSQGNGEAMPNGDQKHFCKSFINKRQ